MSLLNENQTKTLYLDLIDFPIVRYSLVVVYVLAILLAATGNGLLFYVIIRQRKLRNSSTAYLVLNLATCDFISTVVYQPMRLMDMLLPFSKEHRSVLTESNVYCKVTGFMMSFTACVAFHSIVAISQERLLLICYPLKAKSLITVAKTRGILLMVWTTSFLFVLPIPILFSFVVQIPLQHTNVTFCLHMIEEHSLGPQIYTVFIFVMYYSLPVIIISISYAKVFYTLHKGMYLIENSDNKTNKLLRSRRCLAKMMVCIAVIFAVCHGPLFITFLYVSLGGEVNRDPVFLVMVIEFLPIISSVLNPFIYSSHSGQFRKGLLVLLSGSESDDLFRRQSTLRSDPLTSPHSPIHMRTLLRHNSSDRRKCDWINNGTDPKGDVRL